MTIIHARQISMDHLGHYIYEDDEDIWRVLCSGMIVRGVDKPTAGPGFCEECVTMYVDDIYNRQTFIRAELP